MDTRQPVGYLKVALAASLWGSWSLLLRPTGLPATVTAPVVFLVMGIVACLGIGSDRVTPRWDRATVALLVAHAAFDALQVATFFAAMQVTTVAIAVLAHYLAPLLVALAAPFVAGQRVRGAPWAAAMGIVGLAFMLEPWAPGGERAWLGAGLGCASALGYAASVFLGRELALRIGPMRTIGWHSLLAAALVLPFTDWAALRHANGFDALLLVIGGLVPGVLAGRIFLGGMLAIGPTRAAVLAYLEPVVAVVIGWLAWGEQLGLLAAAGGALVLVAGAWVTAASEEG